MIPYPSFITFCLVAAVAIVAAAPGGSMLLALIPLALAAVARLVNRLAAPKPPPETPADLRVPIDFNGRDIGAMTLDDERAWRRRQLAANDAWAAAYEIPAPTWHGANSGDGTLPPDSGGGAEIMPPMGFLGLSGPISAEQLERLANTAEMRALR